MAAEEKTITLTWTKLELQMMVCCLSRCMPKAPLRLSSAPVKYHCPTCAAEMVPNQSHCICCGQALDWETDTQWADLLAEAVYD